MKTLTFLALLALGACTTPSKAYVDADAATYNSLGQAHRAYVEADPDLTAEERARKLRVLDSWRIRVERAGGVVR